MPRQSRRYTERLVVHNTSGQPHKPEAFPGLGSQPVTAGNHTQTVGERQRYRSGRIGAAGPSWAAPRSPRARQDTSTPAAPHRPDPRKLPTSPPAPWALHAGRRVPKLHGVKSPVRDHRREPCDGAHPANRTQPRDNTERRITDLPTSPAATTAPPL